MVPSVSRVAVLWNPTNPSNPFQLKLTQGAASTLGVTPLPVEAKSPEEIDRAFAAMSPARADAVIVIGDPMFGSQRRRLIDLSAKSRLPAIYSNREYVIAGGLVYGANLDDLYVRAAGYVDSQRSQPRRPPGRAAHQVRALYQSQDSQGTRPHHSAVAPAAGGAGHRVARAGPAPLCSCCQLLDANQVRVCGRLVVLGAAEDQSLKLHAGCLNEMEVVVLLHGTGRDHGRGTPGHVADDG
jgi:hypothetical protein